MLLIPNDLTRTEQPQDGSRFDPAHPLAARFHTVYMPAVSAANLGIGGAGGLASHAAPDVALPASMRAASIVVTNQQLTASRSYGPTPAYPITMIWVGQQGSNANTILANLAASGAISGSFWYVGGGSSTFVGLAARNAFGSVLSLTATVPGGSALGTELVIVAQSLSASDHRLCVNGSAVATSTTNIGGMVAWDRVAIGQSSSANSQSTALLAVASGGASLTDEQMQQLSRDPRAVYALFEPLRTLVPVPVAGGGGDVTVSLSGSQSSSGAGSLGPASSVSVSGSSVSSSAGSITAALSVSVSGASAASAAGTLAPSLSVALSGASASASAGTVSTGNDVAVSLSGQQATTAAGSLGVAVQVALSGASTAAAAGAVVPGISLSLSGSAATAYAGTITPSVNNDVVVGLSGSESIADAGIVVASGGTAATRSAGFEMVGHKPSRRLWWMRKPKNLTEEEAEEALEDVAEAIVDKVAEQVAKKAPADKVKKAVKEAVKPVAEKMPGFDWAAFYKQAFEAAQQAQQEQERTQAAIRNYIVKAMADAQRRRIEQDDEDIELLAMML